MERKTYDRFIHQYEEIRRSINNNFRSFPENVFGQFKTDVKRFTYNLSENSSTRVNYDRLYEYFQEHLFSYVNKTVQSAIESRLNEASEYFYYYIEHFHNFANKEDLTEMDIKTFDGNLSTLVSNLDRVFQSRFNFSRIFGDFEHEFKRRFGADEEMMSYFRHSYHNLEEQLHQNILDKFRREGKELVSNVYTVHNASKRQLVEDMKVQQEYSIKNLDVDAAKAKIQETVDYLNKFIEGVNQSYEKEQFAGYAKLAGYARGVLSAINNRLAANEVIEDSMERNRDLDSIVKMCPVVRSTLRNNLRAVMDEYKRQQEAQEKAAEEARRREQEELRNKAIEEARRRAAEEEAERQRLETAQAAALEEEKPTLGEAVVEAAVDPLVQEVVVQDEEPTLGEAVVAAALEPVIEEPVVEEPVVEEPVVEEPIVEEVEVLQEEVPAVEVIEEPQVEEIVVEEPIIEEVEVLQEPVVEEVEVIQEPVVVESPLELPAVVEEVQVIEEPVVEEVEVLEETGLIPVTPVVGEPEVVEQNGLIPVTPNVVATNDNVIVTQDGVEVITQTQSIPDPKPKKPTVQAEEDVIDIPVVGEDEILGEPEEETVKVLSDKTVKMRKVLAARKKKFNVRRDISVVAAAGLFGLSLAGAGFALPLAGIAAGAAVMYAGKNVWQDIKKSVMRKVTDFRLCMLAGKYGIEYDLDELGRPQFVMTDEQKTMFAKDIQEELDKMFFNKDRGLTNARTIRQLDYRGFSQVTIDNLSAAFEEYGGYSDDIPENITITEEEPEETLESQQPASEEPVVSATGEVRAPSIISSVIQYAEETLPAVRTPETEEYQLNPELEEMGLQLLDVTAKSTEFVRTNAISSVDQASVGMFNEMLDIFYNHKIQDNQQKTAVHMTKFHTDMKNSMEKLANDFGKKFDSINKQTVLYTNKIMELPLEMQQEGLQRLQQAYITKANVAGLLKPFDKEFETLLNDVCSEYGIQPNSPAYNDLKAMTDKNKMMVEKQLYENIIQFSNVNGLAVNNMMNHFVNLGTEEYEEDNARKM